MQNYHDHLNQEFGNNMGFNGVVDKILKVEEYINGWIVTFESNEADKKADELNIARSQLIELAFSKFIGECELINNTEKVIKRSKEKDHNPVKITLNLDNKSFGKLFDEINKKILLFLKKFYIGYRQV